ncbi:MAG: hypothetical protein GX640_11545 [Fibrobacter sp.]|nr:hypothetical protein [Fibrobacter sp.]
MEKKLENLCKYKKEKLKEHFEEVKELVKDARFICKKCGRVSNDKKYLCKPEELY